MEPEWDLSSREYDGEEVNVITFKDGKELNMIEIRHMFEKYHSALEPIPGPETSKEILNFLEERNPTREEFIRHFSAKRLNKGGINMNQQMSFAFEDGGLRDDGMRRDPVSGNEVPSGSMASEVRDDIPAQLSEGEYVVPADVVRYYGVKFFEDLRDNAKMGLQDMEARGRIGGEPVPAGGPTNNDDLSADELATIREMMGMNVGGFVDTPMYNEDPYAQQQSQYTMPMQMNQGGDSVLKEETERSFFESAREAQKKPFTGAPLGFSIFGTPTLSFDSKPTSTEQITLYSPTGLERTFNTPLSEVDQKEYDRLIAEGYTTTAPVSAERDDGPTTPPPTQTEPYKEWLGSTDWGSEKSIREFTSSLDYDPTKDKTGGRVIAATLMGGPGAGIAAGLSGARGGLGAISDLRAAALIAKAQGMDSLAAELDKKVAGIIEKGPGILDFLDDVFASGKQKANAWAKTKGFDNIQSAIETGVTPKAPTTTTAVKLTPSDDDDFTPGDGTRLRSTGTNVGDRAASIQEEAARTGRSIAEIGRERAPSTAETQTDVEEATGGQGSQGLGSGAGGMNKGGLMNKAVTKKKAKRQYKKGGLANKK